MLPPDLTRNTTSNSNWKYSEDATDILDTLHCLRLPEVNKAIKIQTIEVYLLFHNNSFLRAHHSRFCLCFFSCLRRSAHSMKQFCFLASDAGQYPQIRHVCWKNRRFVSYWFPYTRDADTQNLQAVYYTAQLYYPVSSNTGRTSKIFSDLLLIISEVPITWRNWNG